MAQSAITFLSEAYYNIRGRSRGRRIDKIYISFGLYNDALIEISNMPPGRDKDTWYHGITTERLFVHIPNSAMQWRIIRTAFEDELPPDEVQDVEFDL